VEILTTPLTFITKEVINNMTDLIKAVAVKYTGTFTTTSKQGERTEFLAVPPEYQHREELVKAFVSQYLKAQQWDNNTGRYVIADDEWSFEEQTLQEYEVCVSFETEPNRGNFICNVLAANEEHAMELGYEVMEEEDYVSDHIDEWGDNVVDSDGYAQVIQKPATLKLVDALEEEYAAQ
jgi:hypothetical protein